jgi:hypothetical protein
MRIVADFPHRVEVIQNEWIVSTGCRSPLIVLRNWEPSSVSPLQMTASDSHSGHVHRHELA